MAHDTFNLQSFGPNIHIAIVSRATPNIYSYASFTRFAQAAYAIYQNYAIVPTSIESANPHEDYLIHRKLVLISAAMANEAFQHVDYFVWMDAGQCHMQSLNAHKNDFKLS